MIYLFAAVNHAHFLLEGLGRSELESSSWGAAAPEAGRASGLSIATCQHLKYLGTAPQTHGA